jgi:4-cresol dehydrogenase (hydroxylating)
MNTGQGLTSRSTADLQSTVGEQWFLAQREELRPFAINVDPEGDVFPCAVVRPKDIDEVRSIVEIANRDRIPLYPICRGLQHGLGMATAVDPGNLIVDLGRMDRIVDFDPAMGLVVLEPGVTFKQLFEFLEAESAPFLMSPISGPVDASVIGNALDKGAGYTPVGNHFANLIGLEIVLGDGRLLTTGDGALPGAKSAYTHKGGCGPMIDNLFAQSNYGIVCRAGVWLMPKPPGARGFVLQVPEYEDIERLVEVAGGLKLRGAIPSTVSIANDLFSIGIETETPFPFKGAGASPIDDELLVELRRRHGVGAWNLFGCVYGPTADLPPRVEAIAEAVRQTGDVRLLSEEEARGQKAFDFRFDLARGIPREDEVDVYGLHPNGSSLYFLPSVPFAGRFAKEAMEISRTTCSRYGFSYTSQFLGSPRSMRNTQPIIYDSQDPDSRERAVACFSELIDRFEAQGYLVSRPPTLFQERVMESLGVYGEVCTELKKVLDPNGIIAPGRYGLRSEAAESRGG